MRAEPSQNLGDFNTVVKNSKSENYYERLGVRQNASDEDIRTAYKRSVKVVHPDLVAEYSKKEAQDALSRLNQAYEVLKDSFKRHAYNLSLSARAGTNQPQLQDSSALLPRDFREGAVIPLPDRQVWTQSAYRPGDYSGPKYKGKKNQSAGTTSGGDGIQQQSTGTVRADYPVISPEQKQAIRDLLRRHRENLSDDNFNPYTIDPRDIINLMSAYQKNPNNPNEIWEDRNCTYRPRNPSLFTNKMREEIRVFLERDSKCKKEMEESPFMERYREKNPDASKKQLNTALIDAYIDKWCNNKTVALLHVPIPPTITDDIFRVTIVTAEGTLKTFEMDLKSFRKSINRCHSTGLSAVGIPILATGLGIGIAVAAPAAGIIAGAIWLAGCLCSLNTTWNLTLRRNSLGSKYDTLVFTQTLDRAKNATSSADIFLPVLAHLHFVKTCPEYTRALQLGINHKVENSPIRHLQKHLMIFDYLIENWEIFETNCENFNTRVINKSGVTNMRQREIDEQKLKVIIEDADEFKQTVMRWAVFYTKCAWGVTLGCSMGVGSLITGAILTPYKLLRLKYWPERT